MTDIVEQIHALYATHTVVMEAAEEIERLRTDYSILKRDYDELRADNARLRDALKAIECHSIDHTDACRMAGKARRALEQRPPTMQEISDEIEASEREFRPMRSLQGKP